MSGYRTEEFTITITYTTNGERVNRITGSRSGGGLLSTEVLVKYLKQFCGLDLVPMKINSYDLSRVISKSVTEYLEEVRHEIQP